MQHDAMLKQLGYTPNEALLKQFEDIRNNTTGYEKIEKHIMDLHDHLKAHSAFVAMSNSCNYMKIKLGEMSPEVEEEAMEKINHFAEKFKVKLEKVKDAKTFYIQGFSK
jgi:hypothetical protein